MVKIKIDHGVGKKRGYAFDAFANTNEEWKPENHI
jgi:hypothetical protein